MLLNEEFWFDVADEKHVIYYYSFSSPLYPGHPEIIGIVRLIHIQPVAVYHLLRLLRRVFLH